MIQNGFWALDAEKAATSCRQAFPSAVKETLQLADMICQHSFLFREHWEMERTHVPVDFKGPINWELIPDGDPEWMYAFNRHTFGTTLAKAWLYTKDDKYPQAFTSLLLDWIKNAPFTENSKRTTWRSIETGLRCENWLRALFLFGDCVASDKEFMDAFHSSLGQHAAWLLEANSAFQRLSNWGILQNHGLFLLGLYLEQPDLCSTAIKRLEEETHTQFMADGTHWEQSPLYHCEVLHCLLDTLLAARRSGYTIAESFSDKIKEAAYGLAYWLRPDGYLICQSDSDEIDARDLLVLSACLFHDPLLKQYAGNDFYEDNLWDIPEMREEYLAMKPIAGPGSIALKDSGNYMLWDDASCNSAFLHMHCGCLGSGHGHADLLHVDLTAYGETILADSGRYTYVDSDIRKYLKSPAAHNTLTVNKKDFSDYQSSWRFSPIAEPMKGEHRFTPLADYISGSHLGYLSEGVLASRKVIRIDKGLFVIWDTCHVADSDKTREYDRYFHFGSDGKVVLSPEGALYQGKACHASMVFPAKNTLHTKANMPLSTEYNQLTESDCIIESIKTEGFLSLPAVIAVNDSNSPLRLQAKLIPVSLENAGTLLPDADAQALHILHNDRKWVLMMVHHEVICEVDLLSAGGYSGYGKTILFGEQCPDGLCLAW